MNKLEMGEAEQREFVRITKGINLFASMMDMGVMEKILACVSLYEFAPGEKVFSQGDAGDAFYAVQAGRLKASVREAFILSKKLAEFKDGDFFGEMALVDGAPRSATITCETTARLFILRKEHFLAARKESPEFSEQIRKLAADRLFTLKHGD
jgi:CRP-like cAMP-binding protein